MEQAYPTQDPSYMQKYYQSEEEREDGLSLVEKAGIGVLTGLTGYTIARRTGLGNRFARFLERDGKAIKQGIKEAVDKTRIPLRGNNTDLVRLTKQMKEDFTKGQARFKREYDEREKDLEHREMDMERYIRQFKEMVGGNNTADGQLFHIMNDTLHYSDLARRIKNSENNAVQKHADELIGAIRSMHVNGIQNYSSSKFASHLRKNGIHNKDVIEEVDKLRRETNARRHMDKNDPSSLELLERNRKQMQKVFVRETPKQIKIDNSFKKLLSGSRQATVNDIIRLHKEKKFKLSDDMYTSLQKAIKIDHSFGEAAFDRNLVIRKGVNGKEHLEDYGAYKELRRNANEWFAGTMPGGILHARDILNAQEGKELFHTYVFRRGTQQTSLNAQQGKDNKDYLEQHFIKIGGKVVKAFDEGTLFNNKDLEIINKKRDVYLTSNNYGSSPRMIRHAADTMTPDNPQRNWLFDKLDIGNQDKDNNFYKIGSIIGKFFDEDWTRNWAVRTMNEGLEGIDDFERMSAFFKWNSVPLTNRMLHNLNGHFSDTTQKVVDDLNINFSNDDDYIKLFETLGQKEVEANRATQLASTYRKYQINPEQFLKRKTPYGESSFIMGDQTKVHTGLDDIKMSLSEHLIKSVNRKNYEEHYEYDMYEASNRTREMIDEMFDNGLITKHDYTSAQEVVNYEMFQHAGRNIHTAEASSLNEINQLFKDERFYNNALQTVKRANPLWESTVKTLPKNTTEDPMIAVNKADIWNNMMGVFDSDKSLKERLQSFADPFLQLSAGRNRMEDFTTLSMVPYYAGYRLQDMLGNLGLGFSDDSMGSAVSIAANLFTKRLLPAYLGVEAYKYADYKLDQWTGLGIDERYQNMIANQRLNAAYNMDDDERAQELHNKQLKPGLEQWEAMPEISLPIFGAIGPGHIANGLSNLFFANTDLKENSTMTPDEVMDDLYNGVQEERKSRWWAMGSKSAYRGDRVMEYAPNAFRQAHSDWEWSGTGLTGEEYFSTRLYPTLENPLGALGYVFGTVDPYYFENKHMEDRPYMLTGELFNPNTMFFGDVLNDTVGRLIKPVQAMHSDYWGDPQLVQQQADEETDNSADIENNPITTKISPGGRMKNVMYANPNDYGGYDDAQATGQYVPTPITYNEMAGRYVVSNQIGSTGEETGGKMIHDLASNTSAYVPASLAESGLSYDDLMVAAQQNSGEQGISYEGGPSYTQTYQAQVSTAPRSMLDEDYAYKKELQNMKLNNVIDPRSGEWKSQEFIENWTEPLGVYKWLFNDEVLGYDPYENEMVMQKADAAYNFSNEFWESNLGSLGGAFSEFGRRFVRKDSGELDYYNPIKNTMPDWLPGSDYFINFQEGDPYSKIPHGERRLPGAAYESLNELHPDEFGDYGAYDRFKILADVAPWSDEYKFWSQFLMDNLEDEELRKEATQIRHQVSERRSKYDFTPYHFKDNDVVYQNVTISKILDGTTFLTKELGDQPIRLAGVDHHQNPDGLLDAYIDEGQEVTIGIAADPTQRISKDTYGTMNAVVLDGVYNINQDIIKRGFMRENQNDFSAPGIQARFTQKEINQGKRWETFAHADGPLNTKFMQVRTAVEEYERDQIYGKDWATWDNLAVKDYLIPTIQGLGRHENPLVATGMGAMFGYTVGLFTLHGGKERRFATAVGALIGLGSNMYFKHYENKTGEKWKPERRRVEEDINEYFDFLEYSKYSGLYENAREEILHTMGIDVEDVVNQVNDHKDKNKELKKELERERNELYRKQPKGWKEKKKKINHEIEQIQEDGKIELELPEPILRALKYREKRDTTIYGIDPTQDLMQVLKAMPYKDKWFFMDFVNANEKDREELMKILPENQKRIYSAIWNHENTPPPDPEYFLEKYGGIPDWTWEGWQPDVDLEDIKAQAVKQAGLDLTDFGMWEDDLYNGQFVPDLDAKGGNNIYEAKEFSGYSDVESNLYNVLNGAGIYDVNVNVVPNDTGITNVSVNIEEDRSDEIESTIRRDKESYI